MNTYEIRTRNWHCRRWVKRLLEIAPSQRGDSYDDGDAKLYVKTSNAARAWLTWSWWMILKPLSGGWTYIIRPNHTPNFNTYAVIY